LLLFFFGTKYFNTHIHGEKGECLKEIGSDEEGLKEIDSGVYPKESTYSFFVKSNILYYDFDFYLYGKY